VAKFEPRRHCRRRRWQLLFSMCSEAGSCCFYRFSSEAQTQASSRLIL
jgi:hypothetical protein